MNLCKMKVIIRDTDPSLYVVAAKAAATYLREGEGREMVIYQAFSGESPIHTAYVRRNKSSITVRVEDVAGF